MKTVTKAYGNENTWTIECMDGECAQCENQESYENNQEYEQQCCFPEGHEEFVISCKDSYGDGWHNGYLEINDNYFCRNFTSGDEHVEFFDCDFDDTGKSLDGSKAKPH